MEPAPETIRSVAFAIGTIALGLSLALFLFGLRSMHFAMAFRMLAPAILQGFSLFLFRESFAARPLRENGAGVSSTHLPDVG
jgi:hypothetical protein